MKGNFGGFDDSPLGFDFAFLQCPFVPLHKEFRNRSQTLKVIVMLPLEANIFEFFLSGEPVGMIIISVLFVALFFVAWKAPAWVKEVGVGTLVFGYMWTLAEFMRAGKVIQELGDVDGYIIWGGVRVALIPAVYGSIVYLVSLIIRVIRKPKI